MLENYTLHAHIKQSHTSIQENVSARLNSSGEASLQAHTASPPDRVLLVLLQYPIYPVPLCTIKILRSFKPLSVSQTHNTPIIAMIDLAKHSPALRIE